MHVGVGVGAGRADHLAERPERLLDQHQAELLEVGEVAVEAGRGEAGLAGHLTQPEAVEALVLEQAQRRVEQGPPRAQLLLLTGHGDQRRHRLSVRMFA